MICFTSNDLKIFQGICPNARASTILLNNRTLNYIVYTKNRFKLLLATHLLVYKSFESVYCCLRILYWVLFLKSNSFELRFLTFLFDGALHIPTVCILENLRTQWHQLSTKQMFKCNHVHQNYVKKQLQKVSKCATWLICQRNLESTTLNDVSRSM